MDEHELTQQDRVIRRGSLARAGSLLSALIAAGTWKAEEASSGVGPAGVASGAVSCVLTPELTEGPYYIAGEKVRRNITDGHPGTPPTLGAAVVDASTCRSIRGAPVDVWHAGAAGVYSGFGSGAASRTFMRGIQRTDARGVATFQTVYPGWYTGRTVHIHVKVHLGGNVVHTGQLFFPDQITDEVYLRAPYNQRPGRDVRNADDSIFRNGGSRSVVSLTKQRSGYVARITMGVHRS